MHSASISSFPTAARLIDALRSGSSLPLLVEADDGGRYVVKPHGSGDGLLAGLVDWIALTWAAELGLPAPRPHAVALPPGLVGPEEDPEVRELVQRSPGLSFATAWIPGATVPGSDALDLLGQPLRDTLFLFDLLLLNVDRSPQNPNALQSPAGLHCLDFGSALALRGCVLGQPVNEAAALTQVRRNPLWREGIDATGFSTRLKQEASGLVAAALQPLPTPWLEAMQPQEAGHTAPGLARHALGGRLLALLEDEPALARRLAALQAVPLESDEERRARSLSNREAFKRRFGVR